MGRDLRALEAEPEKGQITRLDLQQGRVCAQDVKRVG